MESFSERVRAVIEALGLKKIEFAEKINVSQSFISQLCSGVSQPSDRTIADICRVFHVSESWLRTGEGEMFTVPDPDAEFTQLMVEIHASGDEFVIAALKAYWELPDEHKKIIRDMVKKIAENYK